MKPVPTQQEASHPQHMARSAQRMTSRGHNQQLTGHGQRAAHFDGDRGDKASVGRGFVGAAVSGTGGM